MNKLMLCLLLFCTLNSLESTMKLTSSFKDGQPLPTQFTCDGKGVNPALQWSDVPSNAKSLVLIVDDPDAPITNPPWVHWIVFNLPSTIKGLEENADVNKVQGAIVGVNNAGKMSFQGACPPKGHGVHHYNFTLYALDTMLSLKAGATRAEVLKAMGGHIVAQAQLMGTYERK